VWRKKTRGVLTTLSILFAFLLYGVLQAINQGFDSLVSGLAADRLVTTSRVSFTEPLPIAHLAPIASVSGVRSVAHVTFFSGYFQDESQPINAFAANIAEFFAIYPELHIDRSALDAMAITRAGVVVDRPLAAKYGWKIGDRIPLSSSIWNKVDGSNTWDVVVVGLFDGSELAGSLFSNGLWMNYEYLDEPRALFKSSVLQYVLRIDDPRHANAISGAVDALFENSTNETLTQTEQAAAQTMLQQLADIKFIANSIIGAVFFALCFVTANTLAQALRERSADFGVLKTLGYSDAMVVLIVIVEAQLLYFPPACLGMFFAAAIMPAVGKMLGLTAIPSSVFVAGFAIAIALALLSALLPAMRVNRLQIVDALASR
jgi:putative ABC transport system permease protein